MELRDSKGLTESEFIEAYKKKNYPRPYLTADMVIFRKENNSVLLIKRKGHPFMGHYAFPGGFAEENETIEETAARELLEETNIEGLTASPVGIYSTPGRDPRGWVVTVAYMAVIEGSPESLRAGDDAAEAGWFEIKKQGDTIVLSDGKINFTADELAFDHGKILSDALKMQDCII